MQTAPSRFASTLAASAVAAVLYIVAAPAYADEPDPASSAVRLPVAAAQRPITPPSLVFNPSLTFAVRHQVPQGSFIDLDVGASLGVTDNVSVRALVLPLQLSAPIGAGRRFQYGQTQGFRGPSIGATYRFVRGVIEIGASLDLRIFTIENLSGGAIIPSIPVRLHASDVVAIDFEPSVNITRATTTVKQPVFAAIGSAVVGSIPETVPANAVRVQLPTSVLYNMSEPVHVGVNSGLTIFDVSDAKNSTGVPAGVFLGYAVAGSSGPILDVDPFFEFPYLLLPGRTKVWNAEQYFVGVRVTGHLSTGEHCIVRK